MPIKSNSLAPADSYPQKRVFWDRKLSHGFSISCLCLVHLLSFLWLLPNHLFTHWVLEQVALGETKP